MRWSPAHAIGLLSGSFTTLVALEADNIPAASCSGLSTALVEREDWAAGTSSRSTKLVHGGVRYLEKARARRVLGCPLL